MTEGRITYTGITDVGRKRKNNEDTYVVRHIWDEHTVLAVVIDGVGGYNGGEIAARIARDKIVEYLENYPNGERRGLLKRAVIYANNAIYEERGKSPEYSNMSCVLTAVIVDYTVHSIFMAHVGDTRLYSYAGGILTKLSHDHSHVGYREEIGDLTEEEAMKHPERNVISRAMGLQLLHNSEDKYVEIATHRLEPHTILLLCSDGLSDMITSTQIKQALSEKTTLQEKAQSLVTAANEAGGNDNITVLLIESIYDTETIEGITYNTVGEPETSGIDDENNDSHKEQDAICTDSDTTCTADKKCCTFKCIGWVVCCLVIVMVTLAIIYKSTHKGVSDVVTSDSTEWSGSDSLISPMTLQDSIYMYTDSIQQLTEDFIRRKAEIEGELLRMKGLVTESDSISD